MTGDQFDGVLQKEPETLLSVKGVNRTLLERIREAWNRNSLEKQVSLFLAENEVGLGWTNKVAKHFGSDALRTLKENPYRFIDIEGIGFKRADEIALRMGWEKTSAQRAEAILIYLMQEALGNGHVFLRQPELTQQMHESGVPATVAAAALEAQARRATITRVRGRDIYGAAVVFIYLPHMLQYETGLAASIQVRISQGAPVLRTALHSMIDEAENQLGVELTEPQRDAVTNAFQQGLSIVTGSPGTGKSTLVKVLTRVASRMNQKVLLTAPTGRASKNLANITEHPASTIHALLEYNPAEDNWKHNRQNPLEGDLVVIDEGSMVELEVAYRLFGFADIRMAADTVDGYRNDRADPRDPDGLRGLDVPLAGLGVFLLLLNLLLISGRGGDHRRLAPAVDADDFVQAVGVGAGIRVRGALGGRVGALVADHLGLEIHELRGKRFAQALLNVAEFRRGKLGARLHRLGERRRLRR